MAKIYRTNGAKGALLDEYEKVLLELGLVISEISDEDLQNIIDDKTKDPDCKSIQAILTHVVRAGYNYVIEIRKSFGEELDFANHITLDSAMKYNIALKEMFTYNEQLFKDYPELTLEEYNPSKKIVVNWGQSYDIEQLFEHAIVHVLRHRRQIERFKERVI